MKERGFLAAGSVRRVAVIGPGLDFTDKQDGYDFYPQQTMQPFAIVDSLMRLGLARAGDLKVVTLDLSQRVNDHLAAARLLAARGSAYVVQLPRDPESHWNQGMLAYWSGFGEKIGAPATPVSVPPALQSLILRAVAIRPAIVSMVVPLDVNIVLQRANLAPAEAFDLAVATNIFVYYDVFEQTLALTNVEAMLRPAGVLLTNNVLLELPASRMHSIGYDTAVYSDRPGDGDRIVWYQRSGR